VCPSLGEASKRRGRRRLRLIVVPSLALRAFQRSGKPHSARQRKRERERVELNLDRGRGTFFSLLGEGLSPLILVSVSLSRGE